MADAPKLPQPAGPPDAIRCPPNLPKPRPGEDPLLAIKRVFAPIFGSERVDSRVVGGGRFRLLTPVTADVHAADHPMYNADGSDRHHWFPQPDGTEYGWLIPAESGPEAMPHA
jgi:hypothetical protein